jgi:hypothetical protein
VDACNPLLQAHPTWARDEHEGRGISTSLTPVSGRLASPLRACPRARPIWAGARGTLTRRLRDPPVPKRRQKYTLSSAHDQAFGKVLFAEYPPDDTRQRLFHYTLPSATQFTLGKGFFAECHLWALCKVHFYFFYFPNQTFCDMLLHYIDLHVPFWDNYNSVFNS